MPVVFSFYLYSDRKSPFFVSNEKLLLNFVFSIRALVFYEKNVSYARILREESLLFALNENSRFYFSMLKTLYELFQ